MIDHNNIDSSLFSFSSFILSWYVYKKEKCFEILSCIMEMYRVFIKTQRKIEVRKTNSIDGFFAKRWSANTPAQLTAFKQCPCWLRFCKKSYGILSFRTSIFFYVFMNTWRHSRIKLRIFKRKGVTVKLNTELTPEMIKEGTPDEVVVSTGCKLFIPTD